MIMLDNMPMPAMREAVRMVGGRALIEASAAFGWTRLRPLRRREWTSFRRAGRCNRRRRWISAWMTPPEPGGQQPEGSRMPMSAAKVFRAFGLMAVWVPGRHRGAGG